ncbi:MAG: hypothetical protein ACFB0A_04410 [Croceivirga sp.]
MTSATLSQNVNYLRRLCFMFVFTFSMIGKVSMAQYPEKGLDSTRYFSFYNNYWINLHHFLYQKASGNQLSKLQQDGNEMLVIGEKEIEESLRYDQRVHLDSAVTYYKSNIIKKGLLRGLGYERYWLQKQSEQEAVADTTVSKEFVDVLNTVSETYKETYWPIHQKHNEEVLAHHIHNIRKLERQIVPRIEQLSKTPWPSEKKVRVDLTVYANYAGAYTPTRPIFNVIVSTIDPTSYAPSFLETIFHEGSHLLFRYGGPWRDSIFTTFETGDFKMKFPRHLWHVSLFYLCGRVCKEEFAKIGITGYEMVMLTRNIFKNYHHNELFDVLDDYLQNDRALDVTTAELLQLLESKSEK